MPTTAPYRPQVREAPFAQHDNYAAPPRRQQAPKEVRAAPFATYDSSVTGNAYADYEKSHEVRRMQCTGRVLF